MQVLRNWLASREWSGLTRLPRALPKGRQDWNASCCMLVLVDGDDAGALRTARSITPARFGLGSAANGRDSGRVDVLEWRASPEPGAEPSNNVWTPAQLNYAGFVKPEVLAPWLERDYDLLINFWPGAWKPFDQLSLRSRAHLRIARHTDTPEAYDVMLTDAEGKREVAYVDRLATYLRVLNPAHAG